MIILIVLKTTTFQHTKNNTASHLLCNNIFTNKQHFQSDLNRLAGIACQISKLSLFIYNKVPAECPKKLGLNPIVLT